MVLFDEVEKAHVDVFNLLLQVGAPRGRVAVWVWVHMFVHVYRGGLTKAHVDVIDLLLQVGARLETLKQNRFIKSVSYKALDKHVHVCGP